MRGCFLLLFSGVPAEMRLRCKKRVCSFLSVSIVILPSTTTIQSHWYQRWLSRSEFETASKASSVESRVRYILQAASGCCGLKPEVLCGTIVTNFVASTCDGDYMV